MKWTAEEERDLMEIYTDGTDYSERHAFESEATRAPLRRTSVLPLVRT